MMLATPVRSNAWSSTRSTRARSCVCESGTSVNLRRQRGGIPRQDDFRAVAWRGHDRERGTDAIGALLHARHAESAGRGLVADPSSIIGDRQTDADRLYG